MSSSGLNRLHCVIHFSALADFRPLVSVGKIREYEVETISGVVETIFPALRTRPPYGNSVLSSAHLVCDLVEFLANVETLGDRCEFQQRLAAYKAPAIGGLLMSPSELSIHSRHAPPCLLAVTALPFDTPKAEVPRALVCSI